MSVEYAADAPNVLITGAKKGIGLALARDFHSKGYNVIGTSRKMEDTVLNELKKVACCIPHLELTDLDSINSLPDQLKDIESIDILINNAGIYRKDNLDTIKKDELMHTFEINAVGALMVTHVLRGKLRNKVIQISSRLGSISEDQTGQNYSYRLSKAAMNMVSRNLAVDLSHLICVSIHPGVIQTDSTEDGNAMTPEKCAPKLTDLILRLERKHAGGFYHRDGFELPW
ncbi:hypothetical protein HMI55_007193 [Coelomomyces lativittatus]|nr:hypothetical protein HMI55_007193 [Coelomomyces lativittatus]